MVVGIPAKGWKQISLHEDRFWKLLEIKARLKARTWDELVDKLYDLVMKYEAN